MNWRNVPAAFFFVLFAAAEYGNYQTGKDLARVCDSLGPHHVLDLHKPTAADPLTARQEIDNICIRHEAED
jgi:hypothetical protein